MFNFKLLNKGYDLIAEGYIRLFFPKKKRKNIALKYKDPKWKDTPGWYNMTKWKDTPGWYNMTKWKDINDINKGSKK
ncbi:MAG: hypothetical protein ACOC3V_04480 [bacterium]